MKNQIKKFKCWLRGHDYYPYHNLANGTSFFACTKCRKHVKVKEDELPNLTPGYTIIAIFLCSLLIAAYTIGLIWQMI